MSEAHEELRARMLRKRELPLQAVEVPEWEATVYVRGMSAREWDAFESAGMKDGNKPDLDNLRARLVAACVCDASGRRLLSDSDVAELGEQHIGPIRRLFEVCNRLNGMAAAAVETAAKN